MTSTNLVQALHYVELGYAVLPIAPGDKRPHPVTAPHGIADASTNAVVIAAWFRNYPDTNLALVVPDGVAVLDFDDRDAFAAFRQRYRSLADAPRSRTPRGVHVWVAVPRGVTLRSHAPALMPPFEIKHACRCYVVEYPSQTATGSYVWELPLLPPAALPAVPPVLLAVLQRRVPHRQVPRPLFTEECERILRRFDQEAIPGNRHNAMVVAASRLARIDAPATYLHRLINLAVARGLPYHEIHRILRWVTQNVKAAGSTAGGPH